MLYDGKTDIVKPLLFERRMDLLPHNQKKAAKERLHSILATLMCLTMLFSVLPVNKAEAAKKTKPEHPLFSLYPQKTRSLYRQLSKNEKVYYSVLYEAIASGNTYAQCKYYSNVDTQRIFDVLCSDCPELFYYDLISHIGMNVYGGNIHFTITYHEGLLDGLEQRRTQVIEKIDSLSKNPEFGRDAYEKELSIYRALLLSCSYPVEMLPYAASAYGAWVAGYGICQGYTEGLNLALRYYGIECYTVNGSSLMDGSAHTWSVVKIGGDWYYCDPTWDDPSHSENPEDPLPESHKQNLFAKYPRYFNIPYFQMLRDHLPNPMSGIAAFPLCMAEDHTFIRRSHPESIMGAEWKNQFLSLLDEAEKQGYSEVLLYFPSEEAYITAKEEYKTVARSRAGTLYFYSRTSDSAHTILLYNLRFR